jgi:hypothetical protein
MAHRTYTAPNLPCSALQTTTPAAATAPTRRPRYRWLVAPTAAAAAACVPLAAAQPAAAGVVLVTRQSDVRTTGGNGLDGLSQTTGFDTFAGGVGTPEAPAGGRAAYAHQYAVVGRLGDSGMGLEGAFAEGQVRAQTVPGAAATSAASGFDMTFRVDGVPTAYTIGGSLGAAGGGAAVVSLAPLVAGATGTPLFDLAVYPGDGGAGGSSRELDQAGFLAPGQYVLHVRADGRDLLGSDAESNAYYNFNLTLAGAGVGSGGGTGGGTAGGGDPPPAVPLPPAALTGGGVLGLMAGRKLLGRRRR